MGRIYFDEVTLDWAIEVNGGVVGYAMTEGEAVERLREEISRTKRAA